MGNILAIQIGPDEPGQVVPWNGNPMQTGWRAMMAITSITAKVQTTVIFGNSLYMIWYNIGILSPQQGFSFFLKQYYNRSMNWGEFNVLPPAAVPALVYRGLGPISSAQAFQPPVSSGQIQLLNSGYDPLRGYWVEFLGNYFLNFPIFKDWPLVERDGPNYSGFQPSTNNPGTGNNSGGGNSGQSC